MNEILDMKLDFDIKPKQLFININYDETEKSVTYYSYFLYNYSGFFKLLIDNESKEEIKFEQKYKKFIDNIANNIIKIDEDDLFEFTILCDFLQLNNNIYKFIINELSKDTPKLFEIIYLMNNYLTDKQKIYLYHKFDSFDYLPSKDLKMIALNSYISQNFYKELIKRKDIKLTEDELNLINIGDRYIIDERYNLHNITCKYQLKHVRYIGPVSINIETQPLMPFRQLSTISQETIDHMVDTLRIYGYKHFAEIYENCLRYQKVIITDN